MAETTKRLTDADGKFEFIQVGTLIEGDDSTPLGIGWYAIKDRLTSGSGLPSPSGGGVEVGTKRPFYSIDDSSIIPATGESVYPITPDVSCDISEFGINFEKAQINTTTLCDLINTFRNGRTSLTGTLSGKTTIGITNAVGGIANEFIDMVKQKELSGGGTELDFHEKKDITRYLMLTINKRNTNEEEEGIYFLPTQLSSYETGVALDSEQTLSANWALTADNILEPTYFGLLEEQV